MSSLAWNSAIRFSIVEPEPSEDNDEESDDDVDDIVFSLLPLHSSSNVTHVAGSMIVRFTKRQMFCFRDWLVPPAGAGLYCGLLAPNSHVNDAVTGFSLHGDTPCHAQFPML